MGVWRGAGRAAPLAPRVLPRLSTVRGPAAPLHACMAPVPLVALLTLCSECARLIAKEGHGVMWHTPLGLPVVQPYRRKDRQHVRTLLQVGGRGRRGGDG